MAGRREPCVVPGGVHPEVDLSTVGTQEYTWNIAVTQRLLGKLYVVAVDPGEEIALTDYDYPPNIKVPLPPGVVTVSNVLLDEPANPP